MPEETYSTGSTHIPLLQKLQSASYQPAGTFSVNTATSLLAAGVVPAYDVKSVPTFQRRLSFRRSGTPNGVLSQQSFEQHHPFCAPNDPVYEQNVFEQHYYQQNDPVYEQYRQQDEQNGPVYEQHDQQNDIVYEQDRQQNSTVHVQHRSVYKQPQVAPVVQPPITTVPRRTRAKKARHRTKERRSRNKPSPSPHFCSWWCS